MATMNPGHTITITPTDLHVEVRVDGTLIAASDHPVVLEETGLPVRFRLGLADEPEILDVVGSVTWREGDTVGIAFGPEGAGNALVVQRALRRFLDSRH
jgi:hypothetical protein